MSNRNGVWSLIAQYQAIADTDWNMAPGAPTGVSGTAGNTQSVVSFTAPTFAGIPGTITGFKVTSSSGQTATGSSSPITVTGLTNGNAVTFTAQAQNAIGFGKASDASSSVTPEFPQRAFFMGGVITVSPDRTDEIDVFDITSTGNASDWGNLSTACDNNSGCASSTRGICFQGRTPTKVNTIDYFSVASSGNATDFGDNNVSTQGTASVSNSTRGLEAGGEQSNGLNRISYITIASAGNAQDFGDLSQGRADFKGGAANSTRGVFGGGGNYSSSSLFNLDVIDYVTIGSTGNASSFGDLTEGRNGCSASSNDTRGIWAGGNNTNIIDYITIASAGNATDFGDLPSTSYSLGASAAGLTRALIGATTNNSDTVSYVTIASTGNASDFGDLQQDKRNPGSCSSAHGGVA